MSMRIGVVLAFSIFSIALCACSWRTKVGTTQITSADLYDESYRESDAAARALAAGNPAVAAEHGQRATRLAPQNAYAHYTLGAALAELRRTDAAVVELRDAETKFTAENRSGKAMSIYGRARAFDTVGRCTEAKSAYREFAQHVTTYDPAAAKMALEYAGECRQAEPDARSSGWLEYDRATSLASLGRTDAAVDAYREAEHIFTRIDPDAKAKAVYGRARALDQASRCAEAKGAYEEYASLVRAESRTDAESAVAIGAECARRTAPR